jgi:ADP-ribosylglycohydrolase
MKPMQFPNPNMLVYIGCADAALMAQEFCKKKDDEKRFQDILNMKAYYAHPNPRLAHKAGHYTDDTEMSVANAMVLTAFEPPYTLEQFADAYVYAFRYGGKRKGYSRGLQKILEELHEDEGGEALIKKLGRNSTGNGAAMRAVPIGVLPNVDDVLQNATLQAQVTHDTEDGIFSAQTVALMSHFALYEKDSLFTSALQDFCLTHIKNNRWRKIFRTLWPYPMRIKEHTNVTWSNIPSLMHPHERECFQGDCTLALATIWSAFTYIIEGGHDLKYIYRRILNEGGDTDSVGAITWGIVSARAIAKEQELPEFMTRDLESGNPITGTPFLKITGQKLMEKFGQPNDGISSIVL